MRGGGWSAPPTAAQARQPGLAPRPDSPSVLRGGRGPPLSKLDTRAALLVSARRCDCRLGVTEHFLPSPRPPATRKLEARGALVPTFAARLASRWRRAAQPGERSWLAAAEALATGLASPRAEPERVARLRGPCRAYGFRGQAGRAPEGPLPSPCPQTPGTHRPDGEVPEPLPKRTRCGKQRLTRLNQRRLCPRCVGGRSLESLRAPGTPRSHQRPLGGSRAWGGLSSHHVGRGRRGHRALAVALTVQFLRGFARLLKLPQWTKNPAGTPLVGGKSRSPG